MSWKLSSDRFTRTEGSGPIFTPTQPDRARQEAKDKLHEMALELIGKNGAIKSGYLKLASSKDGLTLGRRWLGANGGTRDAHALVSSLIEKAYAHQPEALRTATIALEKYMDQSGNRLGTHSFVHLVRVLEKADGSPGSDRLAQATLKDDARLNLEGLTANFKIKEIDQRLQSLRQRVSAQPKISPADLVMLRRNADALLFDLNLVVDLIPAMGLRHDLQTRALVARYPVVGYLWKVSQAIEDFRAPDLPIRLNLPALRDEIAVHTLLDLALRRTPAEEDERLEVVKDMDKATRQQLLDAFKSPEYSAAADQLHAEGTPEALIAIGELRALEAALVRTEVD